MMQEEELVMKDSDVVKRYSRSENSDPNYTQHILPFTISDGIFDESAKKYKITLFEIFVTVVVMLSTISGGYLEGYTSPAIPSLLEPSFANSTSIEVSNESLSNSVLNTSMYEVEHDGGFKAFNLTDSPKTSIIFDNSNNTKNDVNTTTTTTTAAGKNGATPNEKLPSSNNTHNQNESLATDTENLNETNSSSNINDTGTEDLTTEASEHFESLVEMTSGAPEPLPTPISLTNSSEGDESWLHEFRITEEEGSWLGSLLLLGAALGAAVSPWLLQFGRRHAIIASAFPRLLGWLLVVMSSTVYTFYIGRFLCGVSIGAVSPAAPIYISEVAHPSLRGTLNCIVILGVNIGIFLAALFGTFLRWKGLAVVGVLTVISYFIPSFFIPNSPAWLTLKGRENDARISLKKLRGKGYCIEEELQQVVTIAEKVSRKKNISWKELFTERRTVLPLFVVMLVTIVNRLSGYNAIITYCSLFIREAVPTVSEYWSNVAVCLVQIFATLAAMTLVDTWGRRKLLMASVSSMAIGLILIALCEGIVAIRDGGTWVAVLATMMYVGAYSIGIGPLTWILMGELFPLDAREKGSAIVSVCNWLFAFLVTKTYFSLESNVGLSGTCVIYASVCVFGGLSLFFLVPETKGKSLAEIEAHFSYPQKTWLPTVRKFDQALSSILDQEAATIDTYSTFH